MPYLPRIINKDESDLAKKRHEQIMNIIIIISQFIVLSGAADVPIKQDDHFDFKISNVKNG